MFSFAGCSLQSIIPKALIIFGPVHPFLPGQDASNHCERGDADFKFIIVPFVSSAKDFTSITANGQPIVCRKVELGPCVAEWQSLDMVKDRVGLNRVVVVHLCNDRHMDFQNKNFDYIKKRFGDFVDDFRLGCKQYLRSLALDEPAGKPADFITDFPRLAKDFHFLDQLNLFTERIHSSVLRISGFVDMWLHYDVRLAMCSMTCFKRLTFAR